MKKIPRMGRPARRRLIWLGRKSRDPATALRFQSVAALAAGRSGVQVAREVDVARSTVIGAARRHAFSNLSGRLRG